MASVVILFSGFYSTSLAKSHSSGGSSMFLVNGFHWPLISSLWSASDHNTNTGNRGGCHHISQGVKFCCGCRVKESSLLFPLAIRMKFAFTASVAVNYSDRLCLTIKYMILYFLLCYCPKLLEG